MMKRLISYWVYGGMLAGVLLLALSPLLVGDWTAPLAATFLHLPAYMFHQYEEHDHDRFRLFVNANIGKGFDVLSPLAVFITNVPVVWGLIVLSLYGAIRINLGIALIPVYLALVNALVHIVHAIVFKRYNPGLITAVVIFFPLGLITLYLIDEAGGGSLSSHALGLITAIAIHVVIVLHVKRKLVIMRRIQAEHVM